MFNMPPLLFLILMAPDFLKHYAVVKSTLGGPDNVNVCRMPYAGNIIDRVVPWGRSSQIQGWTGLPTKPICYSLFVELECSSFMEWHIMNDDPETTTYSDRNNKGVSRYLARQLLFLGAQEAVWSLVQS